ncbi:MAG: hypothetical protein NT027_19820 [Proteobacteria bacterium]|nr:hypothetical protein [Pseudomonadota bacterium]
MKLILLPLLAFSLSGCITSRSEGFVNYKVIGDVYGTKPQAVDYEEVGNMKTDTSSFFWTSCDNVCKDAVLQLKDKSKDRGGDSIIDLSYQDKDQMSKTPTCLTHWSWAYLYILPVFGPWVKTCDVEGVAVARTEAKQLNKQAQERQAAPAQPINININNTQNNGSNGSSPAIPAH